MFEIERKFTCNRKDAESFINKIKENQEVKVKKISQVYLHQENSSVYFNFETQSWEVFLIKYNQIFTIKALNEEIEHIKKNVSKLENIVLTSKIAIRFRKTKINKKSEFTFTIKIPTGEKNKDYEFEYIILENKYLSKFIKKEKSKVSKERHIFDWNNETVELDFFEKSELTYLEVEFKNIADSKKYSIKGLPIIKEGGKSNKKIAFDNFNSHKNSINHMLLN